jgi:hypothetical protein
MFWCNPFRFCEGLTRFQNNQNLIRIDAVGRIENMAFVNVAIWSHAFLLSHHFPCEDSLTLVPCRICSVHPILLISEERHVVEWRYYRMPSNIFFAAKIAGPIVTISIRFQCFGATRLDSAKG